MKFGSRGGPEGSNCESGPRWRFGSDPRGTLTGVAFALELLSFSSFDLECWLPILSSSEGVWEVAVVEKDGPGFWDNSLVGETEADVSVEC